MFDYTFHHGVGVQRPAGRYRRRSLVTSVIALAKMRFCILHRLALFAWRHRSLRAPLPRSSDSIVRKYPGNNDSSSFALGLSACTARLVCPCSCRGVT